MGQFSGRFTPNWGSYDGPGYSSGIVSFAPGATFALAARHAPLHPNPVTNPVTPTTIKAKAQDAAHFLGKTGHRELVANRDISGQTPLKLAAKYAETTPSSPETSAEPLAINAQ